MELETDADRREMLLALGGSENIRVEGQRLSAALFESVPRQVAFDDLTVNTTSPSLQCLYSEVLALGIREKQRVEIPGEPDSYFVAQVSNESGMALVELRKE